MPAKIAGPVGLRNRSQNVSNNAVDKSTVTELLATISKAQGGKSEDWTQRPDVGPSGSCPAEIANAIWEFQSFWKQRGVFHNIDGVVDPNGNTIRHLTKLAAAGPGRVRLFIGT